MPSRCILIIEDNEAVRSLLKEALELEGYQVYTAANGQEGLYILPQMPKPSVILLDLMMPVMNGWKFIDALQSTPFITVPVIVVSAYSDREKSIEVNDIIQKPVDLELLFQTVKKWCAPIAGAV